MVLVIWRMLHGHLNVLWFLRHSSLVDVLHIYLWDFFFFFLSGFVYINFVSKRLINSWKFLKLFSIIFSNFSHFVKFPICHWSRVQTMTIEHNFLVKRTPKSSFYSEYLVTYINEDKNLISSLKASLQKFPLIYSYDHDELFGIYEVRYGIELTFLFHHHFEVSLSHMNISCRNNKYILWSLTKI